MSMKLHLTDDDFQITVIIGGKSELIDIRNAMAINQSDLPTEFTKQPSMFAFYASLLADQEDKKDKITREREMYRANLSLEVRKGKVKILDNDSKAMKITEGAIDAYVKNDNGYLELDEQVHYLEKISKKLKGLINASIQRKDMLIQLGALERRVREQMPMAP